MYVKQSQNQICKDLSLYLSEMSRGSLHSPLRHLLACLMDFIIRDNTGQMGQMNQLLFFWRRIFLQEIRYSPSPCRNNSPVLPLPPKGSSVSINTRQQLLEDIVMKDQTVPAAGLSEEQLKDQDGHQCFKMDE